MTLKEVIGMLLAEQVMISVIAILAGVIIGSLTSDLYVPLLKMVYGMGESALPFRVVAEQGDYLKIYAFVLVMLAVGFGILGNIISRIKIAQAIKLGED